MEALKSSRTGETNKNFEKTLTLLRSTSPESAELMLDMLNDSIIKAYGPSKKLIDMVRFIKEDKGDSVEYDPVTKTAIKKSKGTDETCDGRNNSDNEFTGSMELSNKNEKTKKICKKKKKKSLSLNTCISKKQTHKTMSSKVKKDNNENTKKEANSSEFKNVKSEKSNNCLEAMVENNKMHEKDAPKSTPHGEQSIENSNQSNENTNGNRETEVNNLESIITMKKENGHSGLPRMLKRINSPPKALTKPRSHKKPALHELSSRQRIQAILKKGINPK